MQQFISIMHPGKPGLPHSMTADDRMKFGLHVEYLRSKFKEGNIIFAGPSVEENEEHFAIVVLDALTKENAIEIMNNDPAVACGLLTSHVTAFDVFLSRKFEEADSSSKTSPTGTTASGSQSPAQICYVEIPAPDLEKASSFYSAVFDWTVTPSNLNDSPYWEFRSGDRGMTGGLVQNRPPRAGGALFYLNVTDIENTLNHIERAGGTVVRKKFEIGGGHGFSALFKDPNGNELGLFATK